jgi:hypothetical protein
VSIRPVPAIASRSNRGTTSFTNCCRALAPRLRQRRARERATPVITITAERFRRLKRTYRSSERVWNSSITWPRATSRYQWVSS